MSVQTKALAFMVSCFITLTPIYSDIHPIVIDGDGKVAINHDDGGSPIESDFQVDGSTSLNGSANINGMLRLKPQATIADGSGELGNIYLNNNGKIYLHNGSVFVPLVTGNTAPVAIAGADQILEDSDLNGSEQVSLDGSASSDNFGSIVSYSWSRNGSEIATGLNPTITLNGGSYDITLTVTDDDGATHSDEVTVTVLNPNLNTVAYWKLDETSGSAVFDSSGVGNSGTLASMTFSGNGMDGVVGQSLVFDGSDDSIAFSDTADLRNLVDTTDFSCFVWIKMTKYNSTSGSGAWRQRIVNKRSSSTGAGWLLMILDNKELQFLTLESSGSDAIYSSQANAIPLNDWVFVGFTYFKDSQTCKLYIDGQETTYSNQIVGTGSTHTDTGGDLEIGKSYNSHADQYFNGLMDEIRVFNKALSAQEVQDLYQQEAPAP